MAETEKKVQFNLKNVHYAIMSTIGSDPAWETPVPVPGAVTLTLDPQGETTPFYADGIVYYQSIANNGYSGDLEMAMFPEQMLKDVWGMEEVETDFVLIEKSNVEPKPFALLYQIDGDTGNDFYCLFNCTGTRPGIGSTTTTETKEPQTQTSTITAVPLENNDVYARTGSKTTEEVKTNWFKKVYQRPAA
jgi:phi13 family phage major tail protein